MYHPNIEKVLKLIQPQDVVLDIGGWAQPFARANYVMDILPYETRGTHYASDQQATTLGEGPERFDAATWIQRDLCDRTPFPFKDKSVDFIVCSHTLEDIRDPLWVCSEMIRIGKRGYIETPSLIAEMSLDHRNRIVGATHHRWLVIYQNKGLIFEMKQHMIHKEGLHFPGYVPDLVSPGKRVDWLFWEDHFRFQEAPVLLGEEAVEARLKDLMKQTEVTLSTKEIRSWKIKQCLRPFLKPLGRVR